MAAMNPEPPPDGWYWFSSNHPGTEERVVKVFRSHTGNVYVSFPGTDYEPCYGEAGTEGTYARVTPAPWAKEPPSILEAALVAKRYHVAATCDEWAGADIGPNCKRCGQSPASHDIKTLLAAIAAQPATPGLHVAGEDAVLLGIALRYLRLGAPRPDRNMDTPESRLLQNRLDQEHRKVIKARLT